MKNVNVKKIVREEYGKYAKESTSCCGPVCCAPEEPSSETQSEKIGYSKDELNTLPEGADLGLGCGNPTAFAEIEPGDTVLDLGSGAGIDCFLASKKTGDNGKVIGVDMTPEMVEKARENAKKGNYENVDFRLGEIENLPVETESVNVIISNCVINLSENKKRVFEECFRVLKPGGKIIISDIVLLEELPEKLKNSTYLYVGCISGAEEKNKYIKTIKETGFINLEILGENKFNIEDYINDPIVNYLKKEMNISGEEAQKFASSIVSIKIKAVK
ncbi:MAG: arsenite methyltransferase [Spirochaetia bacterium]|nr:arsenite methyltransferase [Spirochaetia bacterium]